MIAEHQAFLLQLNFLKRKKDTEPSILGGKVTASNLVILTGHTLDLPSRYQTLDMLTEITRISHY